MPRETAYEVLRRVEDEGAFSHLALNSELEDREIDPRDRGLVTHIVYGVLTWRRALDRILDDVVDGGVDRLDDAVRRVLRIGLYQLAWLDRIPAHAAVDETVQLTEAAGCARARGLVNAVMRRLADRTSDVQWWRDDDADSKPVRYIGERYSLPNWIANRLLQTYDREHAEEIARVWTTRAPLYIRASSEEVSDAEPIDGVPGCFRLGRSDVDPIVVARQPSVTVQDVGSQLVGLYVGADSGDRVLDACAGLGGKTLQLAEQVGAEGEVVAVDRHGGKLERLADSLRKQPALEGRVEVVRKGLAEFVSRRNEEATPEANEPFDAVLVDAPCSALGTLRRHPEVRWRRREADIPDLVGLQQGLLETAASLVAPGGVLTYAVCSFLNEEGPKQIRRFLDAHDTFEPADLPASADVDWERFVRDSWLQTDPADHDSDVFFAARLRRTE